ncbi:MAG: sodium:proton antiporter NhaD [Candidatus Omnitrophota bacterium]
MEAVLIIIFVLGYLAIALEHVIHINKTATAILLAVVLWTIMSVHGYTVGSVYFDSHQIIEQLGEHLIGISQIIFFLLGAMTIVQLIDSHNGFRIVTDFIKTKDKRTLLWVISFITFFLSSILDNLTTTIVMVSLIYKLLSKREDLLIFASMIVIAANAGGAWTPIGDVTTTMLWIGGCISTGKIMTGLFIPSMVCMLVPLSYFSFFMEKENVSTLSAGKNEEGILGAKRVFYVGVGALIFVPIFRALTGLPPFMGIILGVGAMWVMTDLMHHKREHLRIPHILSKVDITSVLFFLGILLAVGALETAGILKNFEIWLDQNFKNKDLIVTALGLLSAIVDNVPLTAAAMGMYDLSQFPMDHKLWELLAYSVGTGGSVLIIGSAAGVVAMGIAKINFIWYMKRVSFPALLGYFAGIISYLVIYNIVH